MKRWDFARIKNGMVNDVEGRAGDCPEGDVLNGFELGPVCGGYQWSPRWNGVGKYRYGVELVFCPFC